MNSEVILFDQHEHVALITLNRPGSHNAISPEVAVRLADCWQRIRDNSEIRVAVVTGNGSAFCTGLDLGRTAPLITGARKAGDKWDRKLVSDLSIGKQVLLREFDVEKPIIAAINGFAIAGGMELVMACDLRVASDSAVFGLQEVKLGLFPGGGSTVRLPRQIHWARAMEMLLTGEKFSAAEMLDAGLLNYVVPENQVLDKAMELAKSISENGPFAVREIRRSVRETVCMPEEEALRCETEISALVWRTEDAKEGPRSFMEKRKPVFKGR